MKKPRRRKHRTGLDLASRLRGIYERVAEKLGIDPSYVSRVARSERKSDAIESALRQEMKRIVRNFMKSRAAAKTKPLGKKILATKKKRKSRG